MGRPRRKIHSRQVYEVCMRTRQGLPFVCTQYMKMLLESIMARVQRDEKVVLCHYLWMGNHPHIIIIAKDKQACTAFYGEIQKQLTDAVKKLTGEAYLTLWKKNGTSLVSYCDADTVRYRIAYLYANPARANLVDSIEHYPGASSWHHFNGAADSTEYFSSKECPWVRTPMIEKLPRRAVSRAQDKFICRRWEESATESHPLTLYPNAWMKCFHIPEGKVAQTNQMIKEQIKNLELCARKARSYRVMGQRRLTEAALDLRYLTKNSAPRISTYSVKRELRIYLIEAYKRFCDRCRECYLKWKCGDFSVIWPDGALYPAVPNRVNNFSAELPVL